MFYIIALLAFQFHFQEKNNNVDRFRSHALKQKSVNITNTKKTNKLINNHLKKTMPNLLLLMLHLMVHVWVSVSSQSNLKDWVMWVKD